MDKIIYITSGINWSKARKHVEHSCLLADSASLPEKPTYISSALSLDCERATTSPRGRRLAQVWLHWHKSSHQQDHFNVVTYENRLVKTHFCQWKLLQTPEKHTLSGFPLQTRRTLKKHRDCVCWEIEEEEQKLPPFLQNWSLLLGSLVIVHNRKLTWNTD